jgi:hypothetical protein
VRTLFRDQNVGCGRGVSEAITWMLESEEYVAIVEDDCVVSEDFFRLCEDVLPRYKDDERVAQVQAFDPYSTGTVQDSYFFCGRPACCWCCWGWATWRRAWQHIDFEMKGWHAQRLRLFTRFNPLEAIICLYMGQKLYRIFRRGGVPFTWDFQWALFVMMNRRLYATSRANLCRNAGMGHELATNTHAVVKAWWDRSIGALEFPLKRPARVALNKREERRRALLFLRHWTGLLMGKILTLTRLKTLLG